MQIPFNIINPFRFKSLSSINSDIDSELEFHIQSCVDDLLADGIPREEAEKRARHSFGSPEKVRKQCRHIQYGTRFWTTSLMVTGLMVSAVAISWLSYQLVALQSSYDSLASEVAAAKVGNVSAETLTASTPPKASLPVVFSAQDRQKRNLTGVVNSSDGKPIENAKVMLIFKSWPNGRFQMAEKFTRTDAKGEFKFKKLYSTDMQTAFLVSVVADGFLLNSEYLVNEARDVLKPFDIKLETAMPKTFVLLKDNGKPRVGTKVFPMSRSSDGEEHLIFPQSGKRVDMKTDKDGAVKFNYFANGDQVKLGIINSNGQVDELEFKLDGKAKQTISKKKQGGSGSESVVGTVKDEAGKPLEGAKILLVHKSWPGRYRQDFYTAKTDADGKFEFESRYTKGEQYGFLVTVIHPGYTMKSQYVFDKSGGPLDEFEFDLQPAVKKTFVFKDAAGKPIQGLKVCPASREEDGDEYIMFPQMASDVSFETDAEGKVSINLYLEDDEIVLRSESGQSYELDVDGEAEQEVTAKKN